MEEWKPVKGYENKYRVSNTGYIYSYAKEEILQGTMTGRVSFGKKSFPIGNIVAEHFIDNPNKFTKVLHKDGNSRHNNVENLEWCSEAVYKLKTQHRIIYGNKIKVRCKETGEIYDAYKLAHELGLPVKMLIISCLTGKPLGGKHWENVKGR